VDQHKHGLPRSLLTDNGSAMIAAETEQGLKRLGIIHATTLPNSPYQNGKQESFWGQVEGRLLAMLDNYPDLTLAFLNEATQAWIEMEYQRKVHSETGQPPLKRYLERQSVGRECPDAESLRLAFCQETSRTQGRSDGTISLGAIRFEIPSRFRNFTRIRVRYASWNLGRVHLVDPRVGTMLARLYPLDRTRNADGLRRSLQEIGNSSAEPKPSLDPQDGMAPLLDKLLQEYSATGLPPAYLPKTGKSITLRLMARHLQEMPEAVVGVLTRPQSGLADFYREMGEIFGVTLKVHYRWSSFKELRTKWEAHLAATLLRPVLLIDESQEMNPDVLSELRLLASTHGKMWVWVRCSKGC